MKTAMIYDFFDDAETERNIYDTSGLKPGDKVRHLNAGMFAGSEGIIPDIEGTVLDVDYSGRSIWGGGVFVVSVAWEDGRTYSLDRVLCIKQN